MIAIAGGKGGCGKTTSTLGLARALAVAGVSARAVDLDVGMPDLHLLADVERSPDLAELAAPAAGPQRPERTPDRNASGSDSPPRRRALEPPRDEYGVAILPAPAALADLAIPPAVEAVDRPGVVTILDCPAGAGPVAVDPLRAADGVVLVSTDRRESCEDAAKTARIARRLGVPILGAIVTRTPSVREPVADALDVERQVAVPECAAPLSDPEVQDAYSVVARWVRSWLAERPARPDRGRGTRGPSQSEQDGPVTPSAVDARR